MDMIKTDGTVIKNSHNTTELSFRSRLFQEENMYARMKGFCKQDNLVETRQALSYMKEQHEGQFRKKNKYSNEEILYINHPLLMACQAHAYGIKDDVLLASILLHDVVEDTDVTVDEMPFSDEVREIVDLVSFVVPEGMTRQEAKQEYYSKISQNGKACLVKILDRCNNVSTMAGSFNQERLIDYIKETEEYVLPLTTILKNQYPEYSDAAFLIKYQIISLLETIKYLILS